MALSISLATYISGGYLNPVIWRLYETGTGVLVDEHQEMGPHGQVYNFSFVNNIQDIVYTIKLYDQPGGTGVGILIKSHDVTATTSTLTFDADIETIVDGGEDEDPVSGQTTSPIIADLVGKNFYVVQRGVGQRRVERTPEFVDNLDGSYTLIGETFLEEDTWIIKIRPEFVINPLGSQAGPNYKDVVLITSDTTLTSLDFGKLLIVDGMLPVVTLQLPVIADIISKVTLTIQSVGTVHANVVIKAATGETITATGETSNTFILSRATKAEIIKLGSTLYGTTDDIDIKRRGQLEWGYSVGINRLAAFGTEYLVADYPGLKKAMDNMMTGTVVTYAQWASSQTIAYVTGDTQAGIFQTIETKLVYPYKGFFALSDDGLNFRVPDLSNRSLRALNGMAADAQRITQGAGAYQIDMFKKHTHQSDNANSNSGSGKPTTGGDATEGSYLVTLATGGIENRPENIGLIPLIII